MKRLALLIALPATLAAEPAGAPPPPPAKRPITELVPLDGPVLGLPGYRITAVKDQRYCGGTRLDIVRPKRAPTVDAELAAVITLAMPTDLDFSPQPAARKRREASLKKFNAAVETLTKVGGEATNHYEQLGANATVPELKLEAAARLVQIHVHLARLLQSSQIPKDVRTGEFATEKMAAFCDRMAEVAEPLAERARAPYDVCHADVVHPAAWWVPLCLTEP